MVLPLVIVMALPKLLFPAVAVLGLSGAAVYFAPCLMGPCDDEASVAANEDDAAAPCEVPCEPPCDDERALAAAEDDAAPCEEPCEPPCEDEKKALAAAEDDAPCPGKHAAPELADAEDDEPCPCPGKREAQLAAHAPDSGDGAAAELPVTPPAT